MKKYATHLDLYELYVAAKLCHPNCASNHRGGDYNHAAFITRIHIRSHPNLSLAKQIRDVF